MNAAAPSVAPLGGEVNNPRGKPQTRPRARQHHLPALRVVAALVFLVPGGLLVLAGLACLWPWLRRLPAVLDRISVAPGGAVDHVTSRQPDRPETCELSEHQSFDTITGAWRDS